VNIQLARAMVDVIIQKWDTEKGLLPSEEIYKELMTQGVQVPEGNMNEILEGFEQAGVISGGRSMNPVTYKRHGNMIIGSVDVAKLKQIEFD
jgi:hypothetical protein